VGRLRPGDDSASKAPYASHACALTTDAHPQANGESYAYAVAHSGSHVYIGGRAYAAPSPGMNGCLIHS